MTLGQSLSAVVISRQGLRKWCKNEEFLSEIKKASKTDLLISLLCKWYHLSRSLSYSHKTVKQILKQLNRDFISCSRETCKANTK